MTWTKLFEGRGLRAYWTDGEYKDLGYAMNGDTVGLRVEREWPRGGDLREIGWEPVRQQPWRTALMGLLFELKHGRVVITTSEQIDAVAASAHAAERAKIVAALRKEVADIVLADEGHKSPYVQAVEEVVEKIEGGFYDREENNDD